MTSIRNYLSQNAKAAELHAILDNFMTKWFEDRCSNEHGVYYGY